MITTGVDITDLAPFARMLAQHGERFLNRIYTKREQEQCAGRVALLACTFAAKEGVAKALGTGLNYMTPTGIDLREMEIIADPSIGNATLSLSGAAQARALALDIHDWSICVAHSRGYALAMVIAFGPAEEDEV
jgi:holo-[acyl-carrier protein] synthase